MPGDPADVNQTREVLVRMLTALPDAPFRLVNVTDLAAAKLPLMEVFALVFLRALARPVLEGARSFLSPGRARALPSLITAHSRCCLLVVAAAGRGARGGALSNLEKQREIGRVFPLCSV